MVATFVWVAALLVLGLGAALVALAGALPWHAIRQARGDKQSPQPRRGYLETLAGEISAIGPVVAGYPRALLTQPPSPDHDPPGGPPIVLVPGHGLRWTAMDRVREILVAHGFGNLHPLDPGPLWGRLEDHGERVRAKLEQVATEAGRSAIAIGHGTGGLALRWAIDHGAHAYVAHLVTVGTPHHGTRTGKRALTPARRQTRPGSAMLEALDPHPLVASTTLFSHLDTRIVPAASALWGDQAVAVPGVGHLGLIHQERSTRVILAAIVAAVSEEQPGEGPQR